MTEHNHDLPRAGQERKNQGIIFFNTFLIENNNNKNYSKKIMKNTLKTITLSLSFLLITSLVDVKEIKAEGVKKVNSGSSVGKEQNKQVTTEYKSELVDKIIKAYNLDSKNNPKDQCRLTNVLV